MLGLRINIGESSLQANHSILLSYLCVLIFFSFHVLLLLNFSSYFERFKRFIFFPALLWIVTFFVHSSDTYILFKYLHFTLCHVGYFFFSPSIGWKMNENVTKIICINVFLLSQRIVLTSVYIFTSIKIWSIPLAFV